MAATLSRTSLHGRHAALGARMGAFAGWDMPLYYSTARAEHRAVRERCGVFDVSHMGQLEVSGPGAREALARVLTNDIDEIGPGRGQYTLMCEDDGGVIDDLIGYALADRFLLVVNASNVAACRDRLADRLPDGVALADRSPEAAMLALQGPAWRDALSPHLATPVALSLDYFDVGEDMVAGVPCLIARTGYTGEPGVELMCPWDGAPALWDALMSGDAPPEPAGLVARDTLRLEMGYPLYGQELSRERTPIEAGLRWACDVDGGRFYGAEVMRRLVAEGTPERLAIFRLTEPGIPRAGQDVLVEGRPAGTVTSGTLSPSLDVGIGMAYVPAAVAPPDHDIVIDVRGRPKAARTARRPLVDTSPRE
ncbi:MAG TPA: glycine cleavage system aminomethyltransferase GcvT [Miltoncostaeaceae bacterium]|nr:glycine cleavage system aminomethyltransferase GcvT [Miltoncostaeaceae bacterium]